MRFTFAALAVAATLTGADAQDVSEPLIQSQQDAACRDQARAQVFSAPNPNNLSPYDLGSQIWHACMAAYHATGPNPGRKQQRF